MSAVSGNTTAHNRGWWLVHTHENICTRRVAKLSIQLRLQLEVKFVIVTCKYASCAVTSNYRERWTQDIHHRVTSVGQIKQTWNIALEPCLLLGGTLHKQLITAELRYVINLGI